MLCVECVTPNVLKNLVAESGFPITCQYCGREDVIGVEPNLIFDYVLDRVAENTASEDELSQYEYWMLFEGGADDIPIGHLDVVLSEWADLGEEVYFDDLYARAPKEMLINDRDMGRHYFGDDGLLEHNLFEDKWAIFIDEVRYSHRFFNPRAKQFLDLVFDILCEDDSSLKDECVRTISRGTSLYRARSVSDREQVAKMIASPASEFGPTPKEKAGSQRMTPNGISAMYCALERSTCLSEIRSITGDKVVSIAMTPVNSLRLLDLTKLDRITFPALSLLDEGYLEKMHLKTFIASLVKKISKPKGHNDELSYLSTQVVFEYLRVRFGSQADGLVFPSVQTGEAGTNIVLFPEASIVSDSAIVDPESDQSSKLNVHVSFDKRAKLHCVPNSMRYHKILAIETRDKEYDFSENLFMSDLTRKRLGID
jgi:hypothetical protein